MINWIEVHDIIEENCGINKQINSYFVMKHNAADGSQANEWILAS